MVMDDDVFDLLCLAGMGDTKLKKGGEGVLIRREIENETNNQTMIATETPVSSRFKGLGRIEFY
jgi:hypothetical protein